MSSLVDTKKEEALKALLNSKSIAELMEVELQYLGKKGALNELRRSIGSLPPEERGTRALS